MYIRHFPQSHYQFDTTVTWLLVASEQRSFNTLTSCCKRTLQFHPSIFYVKPAVPLRLFRAVSLTPSGEDIRRPSSKSEITETSRNPPNFTGAPSLLPPKTAVHDSEPYRIILYDHVIPINTFVQPKAPIERLVVNPVS